MFNVFRKNQHPDINAKLHDEIYSSYSEFTMIPPATYKANLEICSRYKKIEGCVVECGVWRGGMIAGIASILGAERTYYLFDSFEGLPSVKDIDGPDAHKWQNDKDSPYYFDNCRAEIGFAQEAMQRTGCANVNLIKGWFNETTTNFITNSPIAVLRLDGDWYESTMVCLENLYPQVAKNGVIIIDDYYVWDGCSRAVHDYLSKNSLPVRIKTFKDVCYIEKTHE